MTDFHFWHFSVLVLLVALGWLTPRRWQADSIALGGALFLCWVSFVSAVILVLSSTLVYWLAKNKRSQGGWLWGGVVYCAIQFLGVRYLQNVSEENTGLVIIGLAYFTCRQIHFLVEAYKNTLQINARMFWHYQLFLPVFLAGQINRYNEFERSMQRRRWDPQLFSNAIERVIYGYAKVVVLGNYVISTKLIPRVSDTNWPEWCELWVTSLLDWMYLYTQFSGWSDIAIGFSLMMGVKISENFNYPLKATTLIDFWQRWHISLSSWCKDYVFTPIVSITRRPLLGVALAMVTMGLWHELSSYYILWGIYHAAGLAICRKSQNINAPAWARLTALKAWPRFTQILTLAYVVSAFPVLTYISRVVEKVS